MLNRCTIKVSFTKTTLNLTKCLIRWDISKPNSKLLIKLVFNLEKPVIVKLPEVQGIFIAANQMFRDTRTYNTVKVCHTYRLHQEKPNGLKLEQNENP